VPARRTEERHPATSWVCHPVGSDGGMQMTAACFNRRIRKTARPVVGKGRGAKSPRPHPIRDSPVRRLRQLGRFRVRRWV
jgi:hypothetical protein